MALWTVSDFQDEYNASSIASAAITAALAVADAVIQEYITAAAYADADSGSPTDTNAYYIIRKAIGDLTALYLRQRNLLAPVMNAYKESYDGIKSYSIASGAEAGIAQTQLESAIMATLHAYKEASTATITETWGSGRFVSSELLLEEDDD